MTVAEIAWLRKCVPCLMAVIEMGVRLTVVSATSFADTAEVAAVLKATR